MFCFSKPEDSWKEHDFMLDCAEKLVQGLEIPYRVMNICTGDLGVVGRQPWH
jgi:seryl-tRNA synthetase